MYQYMMPIIQIILSHIIQRSENQYARRIASEREGHEVIMYELIKIITSFTDRKGGRHG